MTKADLAVVGGTVVNEDPKLAAYNAAWVDRYREISTSLVQALGPRLELRALRRGTLVLRAFPSAAGPAAVVKRDASTELIHVFERGLDRLDVRASCERQAE